MNKKLLILVACIFSLAVTGCSTKNTPDNQNTEEVQLNEQYVESIKERGYLIVGCKTDVPDLSYYDKLSETWSGLEIELAYETAAQLFDVNADEARRNKLVKFVGVTVADREEKLENGDIDCMMATYTITDERKEKFDFSDSYYTDYIGLMVKKANTDSNSLGSKGIKTVADLDGKYVGVPRNATTREDFLRYIDTMNNVKVSPIFCEYDSYENLFRALKNGNIDVMAVDVSILNGYNDKSTMILSPRFGGQHYGVAVKKENAQLLEYINAAIKK